MEVGTADPGRRNPYDDVVLAGLCAGSMCWFHAGITASWGPRMAPIHDGLGLLSGSNCPHYEQRRDAYRGFVSGGMTGGLACEDGVALHFLGSELAAVVASRPGRMAYRVSVDDGEVVEHPLEPTLLSRTHHISPHFVAA